MCELFGLSSAEKVDVSELLRIFFSHSVYHPHGWGMAMFHGNAVNLEKEPVPAYTSAYLRERLCHGIQAHSMIAHIRQATRGNMDYENCHPFVMRDNMDRAWTLAHNGTLFDCSQLDVYACTQAGHTDSERILCHIVFEISAAQQRMGRALDAWERFALLDSILCDISPGNKLNLMIYDSELLYAHTNFANSLFVKQEGDIAVLATTPLDEDEWQRAPFTTLVAYQHGRQVLSGTNHGQECKISTEYAGLRSIDCAML